MLSGYQNTLEKFRPGPLSQMLEMKKLLLFLGQGITDLLAWAFQGVLFCCEGNFRLLKQQQTMNFCAMGDSKFHILEKRKTMAKILLEECFVF